MIIDMPIKEHKANGQELFIMNLYNHVEWHVFTDKSGQNTGIVDFRSSQELDKFLPDVKLSDFIRSHQLTRLKERRINFKNIVRQSDKNYSKQWNRLAMFPNSYNCYDIRYSQGYLEKYKPLKLSLVKIVEKNKKLL